MQPNSSLWDAVGSLFTQQDILLTVFVVTLMLLYFYTLAYLIRRWNTRRDRRKRRFFEALTEGLLTGAISTTEDLHDLYRGVINQADQTKTQLHGLNRWLREFMIELLTAKHAGGKKIDSAMLNEWKEVISGFIRFNEKMSPYADLPDAERSILNDITSFVEKDDPESVLRKLTELAGVVQARNDAVSRLRTSNFWSFGFAIVGAVLTVVFGVISIVK